MNTNEFDICCPTDEFLIEDWIASLKNERNSLSKKIENQEDLLKYISNSYRLANIHFLSLRSHCVCEIVNKLEGSPSNVSYHISQLHMANIIENNNNNGRIYYSLTEYGKKIMSWLEKIPLNK